MNNLTFSTPDLSSFCQLNKLGLVATGQHITESHAVIECRFTQSPESCPKCAACGISRGTIDRRLAHVPYGQRSTTLLLRIRRFSCACGCFWHENTSSAAPPHSTDNPSAAAKPKALQTGQQAGFSWVARKDWPTQAHRTENQ